MFYIMVSVVVIMMIYLFLHSSKYYLKSFSLILPMVVQLSFILTGLYLLTELGLSLTSEMLMVVLMSYFLLSLSLALFSVSSLKREGFSVSSVGSFCKKDLNLYSMHSMAFKVMVVYGMPLSHLHNMGGISLVFSSIVALFIFHLAMYVVVSECYLNETEAFMGSMYKKKSVNLKDESI